MSKIIISSALVFALSNSHSIEKRETEETDDANPLRYTDIQAACDDYDTNYDGHLANNKCSNGLFENSICSVGYFENEDNQEYSRCQCTFPEEDDIVIPICLWHAYTPTADELSQVFPPTVNPFVHTEAVTVQPDVDCESISAPTNGALFCTDARTCENRCDRGYIPSGIHNNLGVNSVRTCDEETNTWSDAPFTACISFDSFCDFTGVVTTMMVDENAEVSFARISGPTQLNPRTVGSFVVNAQCIPEHWVFANSKKCALHLRCGCRFTAGKYYCIKNHSSAEISALGVCSIPSWSSQVGL